MQQRPASCGGAARRSAARPSVPEPVQVVVRLRPLPARGADGTRTVAEREDGSPSQSQGVWRIEQRDGQHWVCQLPCPPRPSLTESGPAISRCSERGARFAFDFCFDGRTTNHEIFEKSAKSVVQSALSGSNASILAYGQTSSGKTHSVLGTPREPGLLPLAVEEIFSNGRLRRLGKSARASYFEIFNEKVIDLLASQSGGSSASTHLPVKECADRGFFVQGLREAPVRSAEDVLRLVERGEERRRYAQTRWNDYSSRSHVLFTLALEPLLENRAGGDAFLLDAQAAQHRSNKLSIVDLAGCENHKQESSQDGRHINRSLFFLGEVISRLCIGGGRRSIRDGTSQRRSPSGPPDGGRYVQEPAPGTPRHRGSERSSAEGKRERSLSRGRDKTSDFIPYRDSKLTRVLRSSLGGDAVTLLMVTIHPAGQFIEQSLTSLRFAAKARCVENHVPVGIEPTLKVEDRATIDAQQRIIQDLRDKLQRLEQHGRRHAPEPSSSALSLQRLAQEQSPLPKEEESPWQIALPAPGGQGIGSAGARLMADDAWNAETQPWHEPPIQPWDLQKELRGLRTELAEKEKELATKARLLSERERQLGHLREQLELATRNPPLSEAALTRGARHGPPDEGGGLPVVDCGGWSPALSGLTKPKAPSSSKLNGQPPSLAPPKHGVPNEAPSRAEDTSCLSRAEDITCLRSSSSYIARQLNLPSAVPSPPAASFHPEREKPSSGKGGQTQQELVEKLVQLAVMQISTASKDPHQAKHAGVSSLAAPGPGGYDPLCALRQPAEHSGSAPGRGQGAGHKEALPVPANPDVQSTPRKSRDASEVYGRSCDVDLSHPASRPMRGA